MRPRRQCKKCPWKKGTDPREIPNVYSEAAHRALVRTIAEPGDFADLARPLHLMACHESPVGAEVACVGWLVHQLNEGNHIALRLHVALGLVDANVRTVGPQHACLQDTFPAEVAP